MTLPSAQYPNLRRMFAEAVRQSIEDNYPRGEIQPGYFMVRLGPKHPRVPARIYLCDHEPGNPDNKIETPFLAGEFVGEFIDPVVIWSNRYREPLLPRDGLKTVEAEYAFLVAEAAWAKEWSKDDPVANPRRKVDLTAIPPIPPPEPPDE